MVLAAKPSDSLTLLTNLPNCLVSRFADAEDNKKNDQLLNLLKEYEEDDLQDEYMWGVVYVGSLSERLQGLGNVRF